MKQINEVNLEEILSDWVDTMDGYVGYDTKVEMVIGAMREACERTVDLCIQNNHPHIGYKGDEPIVMINNELILATKKQIV